MPRLSSELRDWMEETGCIKGIPVTSLSRSSGEMWLVNGVEKGDTKVGWD